MIKSNFPALSNSPRHHSRKPVLRLTHGNELRLLGTSLLSRWRNWGLRRKDFYLSSTFLLITLTWSKGKFILKFNIPNSYQKYVLFAQTPGIRGQTGVGRKEGSWVPTMFHFLIWLMILVCSLKKTIILHTCLYTSIYLLYFIKM